MARRSVSLNSYSDLIHVDGSVVSDGDGVYEAVSELDSVPAIIQNNRNSNSERPRSGSEASLSLGTSMMRTDVV